MLAIPSLVSGIPLWIPHAAPSLPRTIKRMAVTAIKLIRMKLESTTRKALSPVLAALLAATQRRKFRDSPSPC